MFHQKTLGRLPNWKETKITKELEGLKTSSGKKKQKEKMINLGLATQAIKILKEGNIRGERCPLVYLDQILRSHT